VRFSSISIFVIVSFIPIFFFVHFLCIFDFFFNSLTWAIVATAVAGLPALPVCGDETRGCGWLGFDPGEAAGCLCRFDDTSTTSCV
jgi:hypothetical protein